MGPSTQDVLQNEGSFRLMGLSHLRGCSDWGVIQIWGVLHISCVLQNDGSFTFEGSSIMRGPSYCGVVQIWGVLYISCVLQNEGSFTFEGCFRYHVLWELLCVDGNLVAGSSASAHVSCSTYTLQIFVWRWNVSLLHAGILLTLIYSSTNILKSVWTSGFLKPLVHTNM